MKKVLFTLVGSALCALVVHADAASAKVADAPGELPPLVGDGVADDTAAIQARLDSGSCVYLPPPKKHYVISKTLKIGSNQELRLDRFTRIRLAAKSNCLMLENRGYRKGDGTNAFVAVTGGIWDMDNLNQRPNFMQDPEIAKTAPRKHTPDYFFGMPMRFCHVEHLTLRGLTIRNPSNYGIEFGHVSYVTADDITFDYTTWNPKRLNMDGLHFDGHCHHLRITNIRGTCFDDMIALNANDGTCSPEEGPISDVDIDGLYCEYCHSGVRLLSADAPVSRVTIRNIHGNFYISAVWLTHHFPNRPAPGRFDDIVITDVFAGKALPPPEVDCNWRRSLGVIHLQGNSNFGNLVLERIYRDEGTLPSATILSDSDGTTIENLVVRDCRMTNRLKEPIRFLDLKGNVKKFVNENNTFVGAWTDAPTVQYVDAFDLAGAVCGYGCKTTPRACVKGTPLTLKGRVYARGFGDHPESALAFAANGKVTAFDALVGLDDTCVAAAKGGYDNPRGEFKVWADGKVLWRSGFMKPGDAPKSVHVDLAGAKEIVLESTTGREWTSSHAVFADWAEARFTTEPGATLERITDAARFAQLGILTPPEKPEPQINGADIWGVRPNHPVIFRVATSGERPMRFTAKNLPAGVTLDAEKGVLGGVAPSAKGDYDIEVTAENAKGKATRTIRLAVGDTIALTPPMGWNSWNVWCYRLTQDYAMKSAKAMHESGLADHGWSYVNLDDWWMMNNSGCARIEKRKKFFNGREDVIGPARDAKGRILPNRSFPDMKAFTDYVHSLGLKAGLYSSPGPRTCGQCEGSQDHELLDATSWAEWGFDYVKYDWCTYRGDLVKPYKLMGECLRKQPRDIVLSLCQYGMGHTEKWGAEAGGSCWRSWDDLKDSWIWMEHALEGRIGANEFHKYNRPGWWADPDMMIVGAQHSFGLDHPTFLTPNEQYTHVSLWAMVGSPLLTGCDLANLDAFTRSLLVNDWVIAISQDRLGKTAKRLRHNDAESVWMRPLANGDLAVALVNRAPLAHEIKVTFEELGLHGGHYLRDCWTGKCEGKQSGVYAATVLPHATKLVRIKAGDCPKCE